MPWAELLAAALKSGIAPSEFWRLGLAEWNLIQNVRGGASTPLSRMELQDLCRNFPDLPVERD